MSKPSAGKSSAPSPYVSLREAVRPAIFAYSILATERQQASALAAECDELLETTRELLRKLALARLLTPEPGQRTPVDGGEDDRQPRLLDAYANAGMLWAKVVGICMVIADALLEQEQWAKASHIAEILAEVGETAAAKELSLKAKDGPAELARRRIETLHGEMSAGEIKEALRVLWELRPDFPDDEASGAEALFQICTSIQRLFPAVQNFKCSYIAQSGCPPHMWKVWLPEVSAEFQRTYKPSQG